MTDPDAPTPADEQPDAASHNLDTARGDEGEDAQTGSENKGPILPPNHGGGGYAIP